MPDPDVCRARQVQADLYECLVKNPHRCRYAQAYGYGFFCRHPERKEIVARTEAAGKQRRQK
ncbi:MAG: hypothetical protein HZC54_12080 [Verrucomicrobia bacterium]|nr:hypothetical protein [Verrucomicrobiota bacterium]